MPIEIERKFLLASQDWRAVAGAGVALAQGYLVSGRNCSIRVRIAGSEAHLNIKGPTAGIARAEYEYSIPLEEARELLRDMAARPLIEKTRYRVPVGRHCFEIDEFHGDNQGLVVAEVELDAEDDEFERPDWLGEEVSEDPRYLNTSLARNPWRNWGAADGAVE